MDFYVGSDGSGSILKDKIKEYLIKLNYSVYDVDSEVVDNLNGGFLVGQYISNNQNAKGIVVCGNGFGVQHNASLHSNTRVINCVTVSQCISGRSVNDANILALGSKQVSESVAMDIVDAFISTEFGLGLDNKKINILKSTFGNLEVLRKTVK